MKNFKLPLSILLVLTLFFIPLIGYGEQAGAAGSELTSEVDSELTSEIDSESTGETSGESTDETDSEKSDTDDAVYSYSDGIDENGLWEGLIALDYVELSNDLAISIPSDTHVISDDQVQSQIDTILANYTTEEQVTDRAVKDADTVNIDYVGSVDGVEFDGGSTGGNGTDVTIGVTNYIDDFLEQLIGHMPGETFNVEVTFPENYGVEELNGKDAVFVTTINYIVKTVEAELTDDFVAENLSVSYGYQTVDEMTKGIHADLQKNAIQSYIQEHLANNVTINSLPDQLMEYQQNAMVDYYEKYAAYYSMDIETFLSTYVGVSTLDELIESNYENNAQAAKYYLATQAIAEYSGITVSDEDVANYFKEYYSTDDYSLYEEQYGMPYLKQNVLCMLVMNHAVENAILE